VIPYLDYLKDTSIDLSSRTPQSFGEYAMTFFQNILKAPMSEPIHISKDSI